MAGSAGIPARSASVSMNRRGRGEIVGTTHRTRRWPRPGRSKPRGGYGGRSRRSTDPRATFVRAHERGGERDQHLVQHGLVSLPLQHVLGRAVRPDRLPHQAKPGHTRGQLLIDEVVERPEPRRRVRKPFPGVEPPDACRRRLRSAHAGPQARARHGHDNGFPRVQAPRHERNHDGQERIDIPVQEGRMLQPAGFALEDPHTHRIRTHRLGV